MTTTRETESQLAANLANSSHHYRQLLYAMAFFIFGSILFFGFLFVQYQRKEQSQVQGLLGKLNSLTAQRSRETQQQNEQTRRYITCLLVLPQVQRDEDAQQRCIDASLKGLDKFQLNSPTVVGFSSSGSAAPSQGASGSQDIVSSPDSAPISPPAQSDNLQSQAPLITFLQSVPVVGRLF